MNRHCFELLCYVFVCCIWLAVFVFVVACLLCCVSVICCLCLCAYVLVDVVCALFLDAVCGVLFVVCCMLCVVWLLYFAFVFYTLSIWFVLVV